MFEDVILEALGSGPKSTADFYHAAQSKRPGACTYEPCHHRDPEFDCDYEWQHQVRVDEDRLAKEGCIVLRDGEWYLAEHAPSSDGITLSKSAHVLSPTGPGPDLSVTYLGLKLRNPLIISACPLTGELDVLRRLEDLGAAAAVMPSLFEEQIGHAEPTRAALAASERWSASLHYFRELAHYNRGPEAYLRHIEMAKRELLIPIIGSLNVTAVNGWLSYARRIEQAGADALELNTYFVVADPGVSSADVENRYVDLVATVRREVSIPIAVKIAPFFTALPQFAHRLIEAGANGLVLFNRYLQPDLDLKNFQVAPDLVLSTSYELRMALRWIAILRGKLTCSLGATGGVHTAEDILKAILVGADTVLVASTLYRRGLDQMGKLLPEVSSWLSENGYPSLDSIRGILSQEHCPDPGAFERANYTKAVCSFLNGH